MKLALLRVEESHGKHMYFSFFSFKCCSLLVIPVAIKTLSETLFKWVPHLNSIESLEGIMYFAMEYIPT